MLKCAQLRYSAIDILKFMGELGVRYPRNLLDAAIIYVEEMVSDGRVIAIEKNGNLHTVLFFSVCDNSKPFYEKAFYKESVWHYTPHDPFGEEIYIEKLVSRGFNKQLRKKLQELILERYPQLQTMRGHRWAKWGDRPVIYRR